MKAKGKCVHFNGLKNSCCNAGVEYEQLGGGDGSFALRLPCYSPEYAGYNASRMLEIAVCPKRIEPTPEEIKADHDLYQLSFDRIKVVRQAILASGLTLGTIVCPMCHGTVSFSRASNGHVHASCSNKGCVSWAE